MTKRLLLSGVASFALAAGSMITTQADAQVYFGTGVSYGSPYYESYWGGGYRPYGGGYRPIGYYPRYGYPYYRHRSTAAPWPRV